MRINRRVFLTLPLGLLLIGGDLSAAPVPEPKGLYSDAEAEAFAKTLAGLKLPSPVNIYEVMKQLKVDPERLGPVVHLPGNATDWYQFPLSRNYLLVGTQRLMFENPPKPAEKGVLIVHEVDIRKRQP